MLNADLTGQAKIKHFSKASFFDLLEAISKLGFSVEIKARPRINPQAYSSMSRA
jgi:hypothetical protein